MSTSGPLPAALAYLPHWWAEAEASALDGLLVGWARACGYRGCGLVWPADGMAAIGRQVANGSAAACPGPPAEGPDAVRRLRAGEETVLYSAAGAAGRVYAAVVPAGRPAGLVWADRPLGQPWADADRAYLALAAKTMARSPAVTAAVGPTIDPDRLSQRLADAAVIAGRMAHDFDNVLTGIIGFSDLSMPAGAGRISKPATLPRPRFHKVGQRGIAFTQQLHQMSRSRPGRSRLPGNGRRGRGTRKNSRLRPALPPGGPASPPRPSRRACRLGGH